MTREEKINALKSLNVAVPENAGDEWVNTVFEKHFFLGEDADPGQHEFDVVTKPKHYASTSIECIDAMIETQGVEAVKAFCVCNAFKYLWRHNSKNGDEDVKKANWYLNKAAELMGRGQHDN